MKKIWNKIKDWFKSIRIREFSFTPFIVMVDGNYFDISFLTIVVNDTAVTLLGVDYFSGMYTLSILFFDIDFGG